MMIATGCARFGLTVSALLAASATNAQAVSGEQLFKQRCQTCHAVKAGAKNPLGPHLAGVVGRKAGAATFAYSSAMKASKLVWTGPNLDKYLAAPTKTVPGTRMVINVVNPAQRAAIVKYLATIK